MPIVFLTGHGDVASSVQAMKRGAMDSRKSRSTTRFFSPRFRTP